MILLPITVGEHHDVVTKVKYLISHNSDGTYNEGYRFTEVGTAIQICDEDVLKKFKENNGLPVNSLIDAELLEFLGIGFYNTDCDEIEYASNSGSSKLDNPDFLTKVVIWSSVIIVAFVLGAVLI